MMIFDKARENAEAIKQGGARAIEEAKRVGVPAYYLDPSLGEGIIKELPDGTRQRIKLTGKTLSSSPSDQKPDGNLVAICTVIGGPNGSGKSTIFGLLNPKVVNADVIARLINPHAPQSVDLSAAKATLERVQELLSEGRDFVFETTSSGHQPIALMERARKAGYQVGLVFVALADVDLNVKRVDPTKR